MKICVIHATAGAGHKKAAEAIYHGLKARGENACLVDALDHTNPFFKATYPAAYAFMVTKIPVVWAFFFAVLNLPFLQPLVRLARRLYNGFNAKPLEKFFINEQFDCIITTQFLSAEVSAYLKRSKKITARVICVVTDFDVHRIWVNKGIDIYTGATPFTRAKLIKLGVPEDRAVLTGIPTDAVFSQPVDRKALCVKLGISAEAFTVLLATGSFGMGPIEPLIDALKKDVQLLVVCGHNKALAHRLKPKATGNVHVYGLVDNMHELMSVADVMVTKPGGLSIAEALVKHLPMVFFSAIPGQEERNIAVLKAGGAAKDQMYVPEVVEQIRDWRLYPEQFARMRQNIAAIARPAAVADIVQLCHTPLGT